MKYPNRLTPIKFIKMVGKSEAVWLYKCKCGNLVERRLSNFKKRHVKSCGCIRNANPPRFSHGMTKTKFYEVWRHILARCNNKNNPAYKNYGARGIMVGWNSFEDFKTDMYKSYLKHCKDFGEKQTTIERVNNNGNYCKANCVWATYKEQLKNRRDFIHKGRFSQIYAS